jgi:hypothetical protein
MAAELRFVLHEICLSALTTSKRRQLCEKLLAERRLTQQLIVTEYLQKFQIE